MVSHLNKYNLLTPHQLGFHSGYFAHAVLLYVTDKWMRAVDILELCFLDLAKIFDTVDHAILCSRLNYYGLQGASYALSCDYLSNRQQQSLLDGNMLDCGTVTIVVPLGSFLGPLLFFYIVVTLEVVNWSYWFYAILIIQYSSTIYKDHGS